MKVFTCCAIAVPILTLSASAQATPITYNYVQTGATVPNFHVGASITIDGTFADLPTLSCSGQLPPTYLCPTNFGPLLAFTLDVFNTPFTLPDFLNGLTVSLPIWRISPTEIYYLGQNDFFDIKFAAGTIDTLSDSFASGRCGVGTYCTSSGYWAPVPEPFSGTLLGLGLIGLAVERVRARRSSRREPTTTDAAVR